MPPAMRASLSSAMLKPFSRALTCLSKYGDELTLRILPNSLEMSSLNSSKSAYANVTLLPELFEKYIVSGPSHDSDGGVVGCLQTKALIAVLRPRANDKAVERCELQLMQGSVDADDGQDSLESKLIVKLHCKHGVTKTHRLVLTDGSTTTPQLNMTPLTRVSIGARAVKEILEHFPAARVSKTDPQLAWEFDAHEVRVQTRASAADKELLTALSISSESFDEYVVPEAPLGIAFPLREFSAATSLADAFSSALDLSLTAPGDPLQLQIEHNFCTVLCVISTSTTRATQTQGDQPKRARTEENSQASVQPKRRAHGLVMQATPQAASAGKDLDVSVRHMDDRMDEDAPPASFNSLFAPEGPQAQSTPRPTQPQAESTPLPGGEIEKPLFWPSASQPQLTQRDLDGLAANGLGTMTADEVAEMMAEMEGDVILDEDDVPATQPQAKKEFQPLFDD